MRWKKHCKNQDTSKVALIVFQNLIPYEKLNYNDPSYDDVAVSVKVIDLSSGDIIALSGITNIE